MDGVFEALGKPVPLPVPAEEREKAMPAAKGGAVKGAAAKGKKAKQDPKKGTIYIHQRLPRELHTTWSFPGRHAWERSGRRPGIDATWRMLLRSQNYCRRCVSMSLRRRSRGRHKTHALSVGRVRGVLAHDGSLPVEVCGRLSTKQHERRHFTGGRVLAVYAAAPTSTLSAAAGTLMPVGSPPNHEAITNRRGTIYLTCYGCVSGRRHRRTL